jgi:hypothetical protein
MLAMVWEQFPVARGSSAGNEELELELELELGLAWEQEQEERGAE